MKSIRKWTGYALVLIMALSCIVTGFAIAPKAVSAAEAATDKTVQGITYNTGDFTVTQDYGATVDMGVWYDHDFGDVTINKDWEMNVRDVKAKGRLDEGKTGLLFTSVASGDDAEGKSITLANKQMGDFSMDFRVFSKKSYNGFTDTYGAKIEGDSNSWNYSVFNDRYNPFLDMRGMDITFTSVSDPSKYFIVHLYGNATIRASSVSSWVEVPGDTFTTGGRKGYGIYDNNINSVGQKTWVDSTTFSNAGRQSRTFPTSIKFDAETMCVYLKVNSEAEQGNQGGGGAKYSEYYKFVRNMQYNGKTETDTVQARSDVASLNPEDFEAGYTVKIAVGDMTSNSTPLKKSVKDSNYTTAGLDDTSKEESARSVYGNAREDFYDVDWDGTVDENYTYDRYANFIIYDINGASMAVNDGWTVEERTLTTDKMTTTYNTGIPHEKGVTLQGLKITANATDEGAVGEAFTLDPNDFVNTDGKMDIKIGVDFQKTVSANNVEYLRYDAGVYQSTRSLGNNYDNLDQYADVRQYSITFRSTVDPTQALVANIVSSTGTSTSNAVFALVEKDNIYYLNNGMQGGGVSSKTYGTEITEGQSASTGSYGLLGGTMGSPLNYAYAFIDDSKGSNLSGKATSGYSNFKLDPTTMSLYAYCNQSYKIVGRFDTTTPGGSGTYNYYNQKNALDPAKFVDSNGKHTYDIEIKVVKMNTKDTYGGDGTYCYYDGSGNLVTKALMGVYQKDYAATATCKANYIENYDNILTTGYERSAVFNIFKLTDTTEEDYDLPTTAITQKNNVTTGKTELNLGNTYTYEASSTTPIALNANIVNFLGEVSKPASLTYSGAASGTLALTDGAGNFQPTAVGKYTFTSGTMTRSINIVDTTDPVITLNGESAITLESAASYTDPGATATDNFYSSSGITITSDWATVMANAKASATPYTVTYTATDGSGNSSTATRTVTVVDTTAPVITLTGESSITAILGETADPGATASDINDGTVAVTSDWNEKVVQSAIGTTVTVTYTAVDAANNSATAVTRQVLVTEKQAPEITIAGVTIENDAATITFEAGVDEIVKPTITATDNIDANPTVTDDWATVVNANELGTYTVTITATDSEDNSVTVVLTVVIADTTAPVITIEGETTISRDISAIGTAPTATATDAFKGTVTVTNDWETAIANQTEVGTYTLTYTATDGINTATKTIQVELYDGVKPVITVDSEDTITREFGALGNAPAASATDAYDGAVAVTSDWATVLGSITALGDYTVTYTAVDAADNTATKTITVRVVDTTAPVITVDSETAITREFGALGNAPAASATDNLDATVTVNNDWVTVLGDITALGTYTVTYTAVDSNENEATAVTITVTVVDTTAPTLTLNGEATITFATGETVTDPGATAIDAFKGDISASVTSDWATAVKSLEVGTYTVTYTVSDGINSATITRTVVVTQGTVTVTVKAAGIEDMTFTLNYGASFDADASLERVDFTVKVYTNEAMTEEWNGEPITADTTLYAKWTAIPAPPTAPTGGCSASTVATVLGMLGAVVGLLFVTKKR